MSGAGRSGTARHPAGFRATDGSVFRSVDRHGYLGASLSTRAVAEVVKQHARGAGLDPAEFAGHSLRAGFVTCAAERGASRAKSSRWLLVQPPPHPQSHQPAGEEEGGAGLRNHVGG